MIGWASAMTGGHLFVPKPIIPTILESEYDS